MHGSRFWLTLSIVLLVLSMIPIGSVAADGTFSTLAFDGLDRTYYAYIPSSYDITQAVPLVLALHPRASSGRAMAVLTGLDAAAETEGFIAVYPDSIPAGWGDDSGDSDLADDMGFITALLDHLLTTYAIDPERIYLAGFGSGGLMAYRLACEMPERFASIAVAGALMWDYHQANCPAEVAAPVNLLIMYGDADYFYTPETHVYESAFREERPLIYGAADTVDFWAARNGCSGEPVNAPDAPNTRIYADCAGGVTTALYTIQGAKQVWPRDGGYALSPYGLDATTIILRFFAGDEGWAVPQPAIPTEETRSYVFYVPSGYDPARPTPLVFLLHGRFGTGASTAVYTGMSAIAEEHGFIAVYPDGLRNPGATYPYDTGWNYLRDLPGYPYPFPDDAAFLATLIDDLAIDLTIDRARIYVAGFSNGGFLVHDLACVDAGRYAAFAAVSGSGYPGMGDICQQNIPAPMVIIHGTADDNIPWNGRTETQNGRTLQIIPQVADMVSFWAYHNGCDLQAVDREDIPQGGDSPGTSVRILRMSACPPGADVVLYGVLGGGHNWPGVPGGEGDTTVNMDINAGEVIWQFFAAHTREAGE